MKRLVINMVVIIAVGLILALLQAQGVLRSLWWFPLIVGLVTFVLIFLNQRRANADSLTGITLLNQGRFSEAVQAFELGIKRHPRSHVFIFNRGIALASLWRTAEADVAFEKAAGMRVANLTFNLERMVLPQRALSAALLGKQERSNQLIADAEKLGLTRSAHLTISKAVNAMRANELDHAKELLAAYEVKLLGGPVRGLADALTAWCAAQRTGQVRPIDKVALFGEAGPDALRKVWPELTAFVESAPDA